MLHSGGLWVQERDRTIRATNLGSLAPSRQTAEDVSRYGAFYVRAARRRAEGVVRVCAREGCSARLMSYNDSDECVWHPPLPDEPPIDGSFT